MARRFRKKPVEVEAILWTGANLPEAEYFAGENVHGHDNTEFLAVDTWEGATIASPGDWLVRGTRGEYYPVKPSAFEDTFEEIV